MTAADFEWAHAVAALIGAGVGTLGSIIAGVWKFKEVIDQMERRMEDKLAASELHKINKLEAAEQRVGDKLDEVEQRAELNTQAMRQTFASFEQQFRDTFTALRQKINDVELNTEKTFVSKQGFEGFLSEYREDCKEQREDMKEVMKKLDRMENRNRD